MVFPREGAEQGQPDQAVSRRVETDAGVRRDVEDMDISLAAVFSFRCHAAKVAEAIRLIWVLIV